MIEPDPDQFIYMVDNRCSVWHDSQWVEVSPSKISISEKLVLPVTPDNVIEMLALYASPITICGALTMTCRYPKDTVGFDLWTLVGTR